MNTDPIADFLTRVRNASAAGLKIVEIPGSNVKRAMTEILFDQGFILNFKFEEDNKQGIIKIALIGCNPTFILIRSRHWNLMERIIFCNLFS